MKLALAVLYSLIAVFLFSACATSPNREARQKVETNKQELAQQFEAANQLLDKKLYSEAAEAFERMRVETPATTLDFFIIYNSGVAHQSLGDCQAAADRYKQVVRVAYKKLPELVGMARLRLSEMLTCLGQDKLATVTLVELYKNRKGLLPEVAMAEVPARLAAAYARSGNKKLSEKYFKEAELGYQKLINQNRSSTGRSQLAKTLFLMGNMQHISIETMSADDYFATVKALQPYLFRSTEMNEPNWSELSKNQLLKVYQNVVSELKKPRLNKKDLLEMNAYLKNQKNMVESALASIQQLYREKLPDSKLVSLVEALLKEVRLIEMQLNAFAMSLRVDAPLTKEAETVNSLRQDLPKGGQKK